MRVIALETSEQVGSVALFDCQAGVPVVVQAMALPDGQRSAQSLLPSLQAMLAEHDWDIGELDLVCVSTGPGSFTGLRIGVTVAKTLAYATAAKLVGVPTLSAIAASVPAEQRRLWAVLDAQRQELFAACFDDGGQTAAKTAPEVAVLGIEEWIRQLRKGDTVAGPPLKKLRGRLPAGIQVANELYWPPQAALVGQLGIEAFQSGKLDDPMQLVPHYHRKSAAEEKSDTTNAR